MSNGWQPISIDRSKLSASENDWLAENSTAVSVHPPLPTQAYRSPLLFIVPERFRTVAKRNSTCRVIPTSLTQAGFVEGFEIANTNLNALIAALDNEVRKNREAAFAARPK